MIDIFGQKKEKKYVKANLLDKIAKEFLIYLYSAKREK